MRRVAPLTLALACVLALTGEPGRAQSDDLYFPPAHGREWAVATPAEAGYDPGGLDALDALLARTGTRAFVLLRGGRIVHERYFGDFGPDSLHVWNSAGKGMTALLVGLARGEGHLDLDDPTGDYLGAGWSSLSPAREGAIALRHHLTMTTGLDDASGAGLCTEPACLRYRADPGTRWAYHNAPYTLLTEVLEAATGQTPDALVRSRLTPVTGIAGRYVEVGYNRIFVSAARDMARFGLFVLAGGRWGGRAVVADTAYLRAMTSPSQGLNPAYGYLWYANGTDRHRLPAAPDTLFAGPFLPSAPPQAYAAIGKDAQVVAVDPARREVWVRMGADPGGGGGLAQAAFPDSVFAALAAARRGAPTQLRSPGPTPATAAAWPNPSGGFVRLATPAGDRVRRATAYTAAGARVGEVAVGVGGEADVRGLAPGSYVLALELAGGGRAVARVARR